MTPVPPASASCPAMPELASWLSVAWGTGGSLGPTSYALARGPGGSPHRPERWPVPRPPTSQQGPPSPGAPSEPAGGAGAGWRPAGLHGARFVVSEEKLLSDGTLVEAREASDEDLLVVHTRRYLNELKVRGLGAAGGGGGPQSPGAPLLPLRGGGGGARVRLRSPPGAGGPRRAGTRDARGCSWGW